MSPQTCSNIVRLTEEETMKCPDCGQKLHGIPPLSQEEWVCDNPECPANKDHTTSAKAEYYGSTQRRVNEQRRKKL
jgi:hypothetical protein